MNLLEKFNEQLERENRNLRLQLIKAENSAKLDKQLIDSLLKESKLANALIKQMEENLSAIRNEQLLKSA